MDYSRWIVPGLPQALEHAGSDTQSGHDPNPQGEGVVGADKS